METLNSRTLEHFAWSLETNTCTVTILRLYQTVQKIGNLEFPRRGGKEEWMESLHTWIAFYTDEVKDFLDKLVEVDDEEGNQGK